MSSLLRSPAIRRALSAASAERPQGLSFLRAASEAAAAFGGEGAPTVRRGLGPLNVQRRYLCRPPQSGQPTSPPRDQFGQALEQVHELEEIVQQDVDRFLKLYKEMRTGDRGYFERFLSHYEMPKSPFRDRFVWSCQLGTIFAGSCVVGYMRSE